MEKYLENRNVENTFLEVMELPKYNKKNIADNLKKGIYFFWLKDAIVYIGMSETSIENRIFSNRGHIEENVKAFEYYSYYNVLNVDNIRELEIFLINIFNPHYNIVSKNFNYEDKLNENYKKIRDNINYKLQKFENDRYLEMYEEIKHIL